MKAILLAGGAGSRLYPLTQVTSKQLQAVYDKPMIYYPLAALMAAGISEFCLISTPEDLPRFEQLLGDGKRWGISLTYRSQPRPEGIAQAFLVAADFVGDSSVALMLGDNIFYGGDDLPRAVRDFCGGATIFGYQVRDPGRYGVVTFDEEGRVLSIEEKPKTPKSNFAVPGIYLYDTSVVEHARALKPSARGELEITDINNCYLAAGQLRAVCLARGFAWLDAGTPSALQEAASYIAAIENRQGIKIGCPEEVALAQGFISSAQFKTLLSTLPACDYRSYLERLVR